MHMNFEFSSASKHFLLLNSVSVICVNQHARHVIIKILISLNGADGQFMVGIKLNYGDSATLISQIKLEVATARLASDSREWRAARANPKAQIQMANIASIKIPMWFTFDKVQRMQIE